jgi:hypothetical protein
MELEETEARNNCAGEGQQQFNRPTTDQTTDRPTDPPTDRPTTQQHPDADVIMKRVNGIFTLIARLVVCTPASVGENQKWTLIVKTWRTPGEIYTSF